MLRIQNQSDEFRYERINDVLEILDLIQCQNTPIGNRDNEKTLSDAEFRRLTFGSIILTNPSILLIDEPTTGERKTRFVLFCFKSKTLFFSQDSTQLHQDR